MYLSKAKKKKFREDMEKAQINSQMNAQTQQQSIVAKAQADMQLEQVQGQNKLASVEVEMKLKQELSKQEFVQSVLMRSYEIGKSLPDEIQAIVDSYLQEEEQKKMMQMQAAQQQMMAQMQEQQGEMQEGEMDEEQEIES